MERFVRRKNIERYRKLLAQSVDEAERRMLASLLVAEEAREAADPEGSADPSTTQNP